MSVCRFFLFFFFLLLLLLLLLARPWKKKFEFQNTETSSSSFENRVADRGELALQIATRQIVSLSLEPTRLPEIEETHHVVTNGKRGKREREREREKFGKKSRRALQGCWRFTGRNSFRVKAAGCRMESRLINSARISLR